MAALDKEENGARLRHSFALPCVSTVAIVRRETNSWKRPAFQWLYMGALAWMLAFIPCQGGRLLGWH